MCENASERERELLYRFYNAHRTTAIGGWGGSERERETKWKTKMKMKRKQKRNCVFELLVLVTHRNKCMFTFIHISKMYIHTARESERERKWVWNCAEHTVTIGKRRMKRKVKRAPKKNEFYDVILWWTVMIFLQCWCASSEMCMAWIKLWCKELTTLHTHTQCWRTFWTSGNASPSQYVAMNTYTWIHNI